ncbi:prolipoprotein diacylglyceryl transferase [Knoellia subterranea KCTC 19937]|uniref:Phosphatidylglycerol--prolipoprotein diacylglyceryl transferase n=1 Tax=Knoellia subterranea KCTC 19937 TaxID=1385521 RepID=A0A0A0JT40_9MICO|nr:prolipoprotein diacylglyceryl transferase [Knoellia subterranea KCTC 19937]
MPVTIPSPTAGVLHLGPLPVRGYALCILLGIVVAVWITDRRLRTRGGEPGQALDVAAYAVVAGIIGGRIYHVITTPEPYWGKDGNPLDALKIWEGGLGIWGAIALGALGAWFGCRRVGVRFLDFADAAAPGVAVAQGIGRWGNWFNNELYGGPTDLPWGLEIHQWDAAAGRAVTDANGDAIVQGVYHPTFLYESLFVLLLAVVLLLIERRWSLRRGQLFGLYVAGYPIGRIIIEKMRTDEAELILGQRLNVWTSILVFLLGVAIVVHTGRRRDPNGSTPGESDDSEPDNTEGPEGPGASTQASTM